MSKKVVKSPFGLFMRKMELQINGFKRKSMPIKVKESNDYYQQLSETESKQFLLLSDEVKDGLNDIEVVHRLKSIKITSIDIFNNCNDNYDTISHNSYVNFKSTKHEENANVWTQLSDDDSEPEDQKVWKAIEEHQDLTAISIIVISFNVCVHTIDSNSCSGGEYYPNEVGITQFTLKEGIVNSYHNLIHCQIPNGYFSTASEHSKNSHNIPVHTESDPTFKRNYSDISKEIFEFLSLSQLMDSKGKKLVFCKAVDCKGIDDKPQVIGCIEWIAKRSQNNELSSHFKVIDLSQLLFAIKRKSSKSSRIIRSLMSDDLSKCTYDYSPDIDCNYHQVLESENVFCALAITKRVCYLFFDSFFADLKDEIHVERSDKHKPVKLESKIVSESTIIWRDFRGQRDQNITERQNPYYGAQQNIVTKPQAIPPIQSTSDLNRSKNSAFGKGRGKIFNNN